MALDPVTGSTLAQVVAFTWEHTEHFLEQLLATGLLWFSVRKDMATVKKGLARVERHLELEPVTPASDFAVLQEVTNPGRRR